MQVVSSPPAALFVYGCWALSVHDSFPVCTRAQAHLLETPGPAVPEHGRSRGPMGKLWTNRQADNLYGDLRKSPLGFLVPSTGCKGWHHPCLSQGRRARPTYQLAGERERRGLGEQAHSPMPRLLPLREGLQGAECPQISRAPQLRPTLSCDPEKPASNTSFWPEPWQSLGFPGTIKALKSCQCKGLVAVSQPAVSLASQGRAWEYACIRYSDESGAELIIKTTDLRQNLVLLPRGAKSLFWR